MPLIDVCYVKSRPGATTTAVGLAAVLPAASRPVVVECDPAGGDLVLRHGLAASPGLVELATATRTTEETDPGAGRDEVLSRFAQPLRLGDHVVQVVVAPPGGAQSRVALSVLTRPGHDVLRGTDRVVIADCGRLDHPSPTWPLLQVADAVVVLTRGRAEELAHLREHIGELVRQVTGRLVVMLAAGGMYGAGEVEAMLHRHVTVSLDLPTDRVHVQGLLPYDERAATVLDGARTGGRGWGRLPLMTTLRELAAALPLGNQASDTAGVGETEVRVPS
ncbi:MAG: chromosome partitioning protein [Pseudonocardiaceae bacterium]